ncbi:MAG: flagellar basal-body rod protein FlgF [Acidobacteriota bacterium]|nr:flagellar basal-body rod protein FlgF [Acidobacteriota bacterium]
MDAISISAASGMRARMESLDMLANNIANVNTGGYKMDHEFYSLYVSPDAGDSPDTLPVIEKPWTDHAQGVLRSTGNPLDFALSGTGFFAVNGPKGALYTRNGSFRLSSAGVLTTTDGYPVRTTDGKTVQTQSTAPLDVSTDGTIRQEGQSLGQLDIAGFKDSAALNKQGNNYFYKIDPKTRTVAAAAEVKQGHVEDSNVGPADAAVRLVSVMRQFEMLNKAMSLGVEMNKRAIEEVARVGS